MLLSLVIIHRTIVHDLKVLQNTFKDRDTNDLQNDSIVNKKLFLENHSTTNKEYFMEVISDPKKKLCRRNI